MKTPSKNILDIAMEACEADDNLGVCLNCGEVADCVEPDAEYYECEACGEEEVFGAEQIIIRFGGTF